MSLRAWSFLLLTLNIVLFPVAEAQAGWCGENGLVRLSFSEGPELQPVATVAPDEHGMTQVDLYAWLTDVVPLQKNGEAFLGTAAFELTLVIEGAEGFITKEEFPQPAHQVGQGPGTCIVGLYPGVNFKDGAAQLVHWQILFQGTPENVIFRLDPEGLFTCARTEGCPGSGVSALYTGTEAARNIGSVFGAGQVPAYLNCTGEPDLTPVHGTVSWQDVGVYELR